ncbi:MAG: hypothetical protein GY803_12990, partial [Chloroflexi bacterium]|nr:hypothetical protein [Chloroflexota bacterium]
VPHWFDAEILAALRPELAEKAGELYAALQNLPFVEPFEGRGHNIHELTREAMLKHFWQDNRAEYVLLSQRAAGIFNERYLRPVQPLFEKLRELGEEEPDEEQQRIKLQEWLKTEGERIQAVDQRLRIEHIYHLLIADPEAGAETLRNQGWQWHDNFEHMHATLTALMNTVREHYEADRLSPRGWGWLRYFESL